VNPKEAEQYWKIKPTAKRAKGVALEQVAA